LVAVVLLVPVYAVVVAELIDRAFLHPDVYRFRDSLF
jgi:hypothetical protein